MLNVLDFTASTFNRLLVSFFLSLSLKMSEPKKKKKNIKSFKDFFKTNPLIA